jgi:hypothetical protein
MLKQLQDELQACHSKEADVFNQFTKDMKAAQLETATALAKLTMYVAMQPAAEEPTCQ